MSVNILTREGDMATIEDVVKPFDPNDIVPGDVIPEGPFEGWLVTAYDDNTGQLSLLETFIESVYHAGDVAVTIKEALQMKLYKNEHIEFEAGKSIPLRFINDQDMDNIQKNILSRGFNDIATLDVGDNQAASHGLPLARQYWHEYSEVEYDHLRCTANFSTGGKGLSTSEDDKCYSRLAADVCVKDLGLN